MGWSGRLCPGLLRDGWLERMRMGRSSFYRLAARGIREFATATPRIYGPLSRPWNGRLRLVLADAATDRIRLDQAGYALIAPGVLIAPDSALAPDVCPLPFGGRRTRGRPVPSRARLACSHPGCVLCSISEAVRTLDCGGLGPWGAGGYGRADNTHSRIPPYRAARSAFARSLAAAAVARPLCSTALHGPIYGCRPRIGAMARYLGKRVRPPASGTGPAMPVQRRRIDDARRRLGRHSDQEADASRDQNGV